MTVAPTWLEGAQRYKAKCGHVAHHDGTCDAMYPGTWRERDGRCVLHEGHRGAHLYRRERVHVPTREQAYKAAREQRRRDRLRLERSVQRQRADGVPT